MKNIITLLLLAIFPAFIFAQSVTTNAATDISYTSVTLNAEGTSLNPSSTYKVEFHYALTSGGYTGTDYVTSNTFTGSSTFNFSKGLTSISPGTTYYVTPLLYSKSGFIWTYAAQGLEVSFTTLTAAAPTLTTGTATNVTYTSFDINTNNISSENGSAITEQGIVYSTTNNPPTIFDSKVTYTPLGIGNYNVSLTGLATGTTYYVRAFATNGIGTAYGATTITQATLTPAVPTVTIGNNFSSITASSANNTANNCTAENGSAVTDKGIVYATHTSPEISDNYFSTGTSGLGTFNGSITGLSQLTKYYTRAYAQNGIGVGYSATEKSFITLATVDAQIDSIISPDSALLNIYFKGGSGAKCIIYMRENDQSFSDPANGSEYSFSPVFGSGDDLGGGTYVVYSGAAAKGTILVSGLENNKDYYFRIATYSGTGASAIYDINMFDYDSEDSHLPVSLISFGAVASDHVIDLSWVTASEINNHYFAVERSVDGIYFNEVGSVLGAGNSNGLNTYSFIDNFDFSGTVYYRLRQVDFDGAANLSQVVALSSNQPNLDIKTISVDGNAVNIVLNTTNINSELNIVDVNGKIVKTVSLSAAGTHQFRLSTIDLPKGVYFINLFDHQSRVTKKVVL